MTDLLFLLAAAAAGALTALAYFGLLHASLRRLPAARAPWRHLLGGYLLRVTLALAVFCVLCHGPATRLAAALMAFYLVRTLVIRRVIRPATGGPG